MTQSTVSKSGRAALAVAVLAALGVAPGSARADAIDGRWCHGDGRSFSIEGPQIVTPGGQAITGDYDRHAFAYVVPPREPGAGGQVSMNLLDDDHVSVRAGDGEAKVWRRCSRPTS